MGTASVAPQPSATEDDASSSLCFCLVNRPAVIDLRPVGAAGRWHVVHITLSVDSRCHRYRPRREAAEITAARRVRISASPGGGANVTATLPVG